MILLNGHSIDPKRKIPLESMSLQLKERDSTATIVPADMTGIGVNSWMKDDTEPGAGIVWRVRSISQAYATKTPTVQLEHLINSLADRIRATLEELKVPMLVPGITNQIFPILSDAVLGELAKNISFTEMGRVDETHRAIRFCTSWATTEQNVEFLCAELKRLLA